jgi:preprotein translocase subunit SecE
MSQMLWAFYPGNYPIAVVFPAALMLAGLWIVYRSVNMPALADFLIAVEAEMNKVSWPSRGELMTASMVVLVCILFLGFLLAAYDFVWIWVFKFLRIY